MHRGKDLCTNGGFEMRENGELLAKNVKNGRTVFARFAALSLERRTDDPLDVLVEVVGNIDEPIGHFTRVNAVV